MKLTDFEKKSPHDLQAFLQRLAKFFKTSEEDSFYLIRREIENSFPYFYRQDDLIDEAFSRLLFIDTKYRQNGREIQNYKFMVKKIVRLMCHEMDRERTNPNPSISDDPPYDFSSPVDGMIEAIEKELKSRCYHRCIEENPEKLEVFHRYHPDTQMDRRQLSELHKSVAGEFVEGDGTPGRKKNTLEVRMLRVRGLLEDCVRPCFEAESSKHPELQRLYEQRRKPRSN